LKYNEEVKKNR